MKKLRRDEHQKAVNNLNSVENLIVNNCRNTEVGKLPFIIGDRFIQCGAHYFHQIPFGNTLRFLIASQQIPDIFEFGFLDGIELGGFLFLDFLWLFPLYLNCCKSFNGSFDGWFEQLIIAR